MSAKIRVDTVKGVVPSIQRLRCQCGDMIECHTVRSHIPVWQGECEKCGNCHMFGQPYLLKMVIDYMNQMEKITPMRLSKPLREAFKKYESEERNVLSQSDGDTTCGKTNTKK